MTPEQHAAEQADALLADAAHPLLLILLVTFIVVVGAALAEGLMP